MSLFDSVDTCHTRIRTYRIAEYRGDEEFLDAQAFDSDAAIEMVAFVGSHGTSYLLHQLRDAPFRHTSRLNKTRGTRFSDGSFPVFYSALEVETAEAEIKHWFPKRFEVPLSGRRTVFYVRFFCEFAGMTKDLRSGSTTQPELTAEDYRFCQQLGAKAVAANLDGFLTPSARKADGTNVPVFNREALDLPAIEARVAVTLDSSTGVVSVGDR